MIIDVMFTNEYFRCNEHKLHNSNIAGGSCSAAGDLSLNSKCYRRFPSDDETWFSASNRCLTNAGSLAVFNDVSLNTTLTGWLDTDKTYWVGLVRSWWKTTTQGRLYEVSFSLATLIYVIHGKVPFKQ